MLRKFLISIIFIFSAVNSYSQIDSVLSKKIDSLVKIDQKWRGLVRKINNKEVDSISLETAFENNRITDSLNYLQLKLIFKANGYLGYNKVGKISSHNFWLLIQHMDKFPCFQDSVLSKMKIEAEKGNASAADYAYLFDRVKVNTGKLQIYGTQMILNKDASSYEPKPLIEPEKLDERRNSVGLPPEETYIKIMNEHYFGTLKKVSK